MTDVIDPTVNGTPDATDTLVTDDLNPTSNENAEDMTEMIEENDSSGNANLDAEDANDDSNAFPDTSQSDPNENLTADGEETETEDIPEEKVDELLKGSMDGELQDHEDGSMDLTDMQLVKAEPHDDDTLISQDENELLDEDDPNSPEDAEPVLLNDSAGASKALALPSSLKSASGHRPVRNGDTEDKPLLIKGLLSKPESSSKNSRNFSVSDGTAIAKELEDQVSKLNQLLVLKEKEWSAILRLKKHVEYALDQVKCTQRISKMQEGLNGPMSTTDINACMNLIVSDKETFSLAERQIEESIESAETENESLQTIFPFRSQSKDSSSGASPSKDENSLTASAALQKLCERKRKAMDDLAPGKNSRLRITEVHSNANASQIQSKVIGNGRKGAIVDVQSIIQSHRNLTEEKATGKQSKSFSSSPNANLRLKPDRQYLKTLEELVAMAEAERKIEALAQPSPSITTTTTPTTQVSRSITPKPKNGKSGRQSTGSNSLVANLSSGGSGTLAKMLSPSTHSSLGSSRNSNDVSSSQKFTKLPTSDANLSLANLLATSKVETKVNLTKVKKERIVRDEDNSHVPSQQEAVPICQGCNLSRAQFVCAGCANQWYCSRECQVAAWDEHSEICSG